MRAREECSVVRPVVFCEDVSHSHVADFGSYDVLWGPVSLQDGIREGALSGCESILIRPAPTAELANIMNRVRALVPSDHFSCPSDTAVSLARRLATSEWLDDIHVLQGGKGPRRVALNKTTYSQPRRVTMSTEAPTAVDEERPKGMIKLYCYTQYGRLPEDWRCRLMPVAVQELMVYLWKVARSTGALTAPCAQSPPTACQLNMYFTLFAGSIGRHRDNFCQNHLMQWCYG